MCDARVTVVLIWPWPGRDDAPVPVADALFLARALPTDDTPRSTADASQAQRAVVLAGDDATGPVLAIINTDSGVREYEHVIGAAANQGLFVYAGSPGPAGSWRYETPDVNSRPQRRRAINGVLVVTATDLTEYHWPSLEVVPDADIARRARLLLAHPAGIEPLILRYAAVATGAST